MNKDERKRLEALQKDATKCAGSFGLEKLTVPDLLLLLHKDENLRKLIRKIATGPAADAHSDAPEMNDMANNKEEDRDSSAGLQSIALTAHPAARIMPSPPIDALRQQLAPELMLLRTVQADAEIAAAWLGKSDENEGRELLQLVVCAAQWDLLSELWEKLANRCKQEQRAASATELAILHGALSLYNLRWQNREAKLVEVAIGSAYDYERNQRGTPTGNIVHALWLPGLINAGGQLQKKPLVQT